MSSIKNGETTNYQYDYLSRRITKETNGITTEYVYDGWNPISEKTPTLTKYYTWGMDLSGSLQGAGGVGGLLSVTEISSDPNATHESVSNNATHESVLKYYPTYDGNGNVSEYLDSTGLSVAHYEYDAFGNTIASKTTGANAFAYRFWTKALDSETGFYYYGYRYYDPVTGTWPSRDPIGENRITGELNLYAFSKNNGINSWDYLGLKCCPEPDGPKLKSGYICCEGEQIKKGRGGIHNKKCDCKKNGGTWTTVVECDYDGNLCKCLLENSPSASVARAGGLGLGIASWASKSPKKSLAMTKCGVTLAAIDWITGMELCGAPKCCKK